MPAKNDYTLSIEEVSKRLNKSIRTIHRYKDGGRLSFIVGPTQGNPLFFSRAEVEAMARELFPGMAPVAAAEPSVDPQFWDRLARVEKLLGVLEANPSFEHMLSRVSDAKPTARPRIEEILGDLLQQDDGQKPLDNKALGRLLVRLGTLLVED